MTAAPSPARARSASGRTLDGPQPNRPSAGRSSAGMVMLIRAMPLSFSSALRMTTARAAGVRNRAVDVRVCASSGRDLGRGRGLDRVEALDLFGLARVGPDVAGRGAHEAAGPLLLEDVRAPAGGAGTGEHRGEHVRRHLGEVEDD